MKIAVCPGSFDPVTNGHIDIIERAARICDKVTVAILNNSSKTALFTVEERLELIRRTCSHIENIEVESFSGLLTDFMKLKNASVIIKGLRAVSDFEFEMQMALMNRKLDSNVETMFMMTNNKYSYLSSSLVKEVARLGGDIKGLVPANIEEDIINRYR